MSTSTEQVLSDNNLLSEILIRLPEKPLFRFKSVSKHWLGLITSNPLFSRYNNPDPYLVSGLFHPCFETNSPIVELIPLRHNNNQLIDGDVSKSVSSLSITGLSAFTILSSSRGLLLCCGYSKRDSCFGCFILNPTTKQFTVLPELEHDEFQVEGVCLAFDPYLSPKYYKVVVLWTQPRQQNDEYYNIEIYSSETCSWRASGETITINANLFHFQPGNCVYCNGAIHWVADGDESVYFNIEQDFLGILSMPPLPEGKRYYDREIRKIFESRNHLHVVDIFGPQFNVFELENDYSGWFVKYRVDLNAIRVAFPEMNEILGERSFYETYKILSIVREEDDESFMVIDVRGRFLRYGLVGEAFQTIYDEGVVDNVTPYLWWDVHHYIKSYASVGNNRSGQARKRPLTLQREGRRGGGRGRARGRPSQRIGRGQLGQYTTNLQEWSTVM